MEVIKSSCVILFKDCCRMKILTGERSSDTWSKLDCYSKSTLFPSDLVACLGIAPATLLEILKDFFFLLFLFLEVDSTYVSVSSYIKSSFLIFLPWVKLCSIFLNLLSNDLLCLICCFRKTVGDFAMALKIGDGRFRSSEYSIIELSLLRRSV